MILHGKYPATNTFCHVEDGYLDMTNYATFSRYSIGTRGIKMSPIWVWRFDRTVMPGVSLYSGVLSRRKGRAKK